MNNLKPNFLIVGAAKAGTTALYYYLKQHPEIGFPELKEPKYFSSYKQIFPHRGIGDKSVDKFAVKNWREYLDLFKGLERKKLIGEASPDYLFYHKHTAPLIKENLGDIPIIIMLRDPVKRAFSAYSYLKRDNREFLSFVEALKSENYRAKNNWDFIWQYQKGSEYAEQILTFTSKFSSVHIVIFEEFVENTLFETNKVFEFLGVSKLPQIDSIKHNVSGTPKNAIVKFILRRDNTISTYLRELIKRIFKRKFLEKISAKNLKPIEISKKDYDYLFKLLKENIKSTENILNKKIKKWGNTET